MKAEGGIIARTSQWPRIVQKHAVFVIEHNDFNSEVKMFSEYYKCIGLYMYAICSCTGWVLVACRQKQQVSIGNVKSVDL